MDTDNNLYDFMKPFKDRPEMGIGEAVYDCLYEAITTGKLPAGSKLNEITLSKAFDVSRTPIQKALVKLECAGLITTDRKRGHIVASFSYAESSEINEFYLALHTTSMIMCKRRGIDSYYKELLKKRISKMDEETNLSAFMALIEDFHYQTACCTRNPIYIESVKLAGDKARLMGMIIPTSSMDVEAFMETTKKMIHDLYELLINGSIASLSEYMEVTYIPHIRDFGNLCLEYKTMSTRQPHNKFF